MQTKVIDRATCRKNLRFEAIGEKCMENYPSDNVWQAVEKCRLLKRDLLLIPPGHSEPYLEGKEVAEYLELNAAADYFAEKMANLELRGVI